MKLVELQPERAVGSRLAHGHRLGNGEMLKKGHVITEADARALEIAGIAMVSAVVFDSSDVDEDEAALSHRDLPRDATCSNELCASQTRQRMCASQTRQRMCASQTRQRMYASVRRAPGAPIYLRPRAASSCFDRDHIDALNAVDESITIATLPPYAVVDEGAMVATVKIIPFAVPRDLLAHACGLGDRARGDVSRTVCREKSRNGDHDPSLCS